MKNKRIVITGMGVISSCGIGQEAFNNAIFNGLSGIKPISLFDTSSFTAKLAGEIKDFRPQDFLGEKGLRTLDRSTKLVSSATKLALDDARLEINEENTHRIGVALGTTLGSAASICDFDRDAIKEGPRYVNPAHFPNTVINSPASQVSIKFNIKGFNTTISTGFSAGLDAVNYAVDMVNFSKADIVLAGGVEELCLQTFLGFYKMKCLAGLNGRGPEISCPFDKRRNGVILGEGSTVLVLEDLESALKRKATIYAQVLGFGMGVNLQTAMRLAIKEAAIKPQEIDYLSAAANSTKETDRLETEAVKEVFGQDAYALNISSIKSVIGECFSASASLQMAAAISAIQKQLIPPTINYQEKDPSCDLNYVVNKAKSSKINKVLINAFSSSGNNSSLVISKF
jgi:3-oxoacyl-[acyl-carrier-protein] synthase II